MIWDIPLAEFDAAKIDDYGGFLRPFRDLDGDGGPDVVLNFQVSADAFERRAISLRDGRMLWSQSVGVAPEDRSPAVVGDLDGDGRAEVVAIDRRLDGPSPGVQLTALDGRDGSTRWAYRPRRRGQEPEPRLRDLCLASLEGNGQKEVCVTIDLADGRYQALILDANGRERCRRDLPMGSSTLKTADLDGNGRDELLFAEGNRIFATRGDLGELWSRPSPASGRETIRRIIPAPSGRSATVVLDSMIGLDGATGRIRWSGSSSASEILDEGDASDRPRLLGGSEDETVCRIASARTPEGTDQPARVELARPRPIRDDPRWERPVPWAVGQSLYLHPGILIALGGLALINVMLPLAIVKVAIRRRVRGVLLLLALPVVVAIPMAVFLTIDSLEPVPHDPPWIVGTVSTLAGIPVLVYLSQLGRSLILGRWKRFDDLGPAHDPGIGRDRGSRTLVGHETDGAHRALRLVGLARPGFGGRLCGWRADHAGVGRSRSGPSREAVSTAGRRGELFGRGASRVQSAGHPGETRRGDGIIPTRRRLRVTLATSAAPLMIGRPMSVLPLFGRRTAKDRRR